MIKQQARSKRIMYGYPSSDLAILAGFPAHGAYALELVTGTDKRAGSDVVTFVFGHPDKAVVIAAAEALPLPYARYSMRFDADRKRINWKDIEASAEVAK